MLPYISLKKPSIVFLLWFATSQAFSQLSGIVLSNNEPIIGATLRWQNDSKGTASDTEGKFSLKKTIQNHQLIISAIGYRTDTLMVHSLDFLRINLEPQTADLQEVTIRSQSSVIDRLNPIQTEIITTKILAKAACCNLSESFETNASVSVSYADAITGAKQIQLLGLSGNYVQINTENIPNIRGLNSIFGLNYIPGTWISSIDVGKGVGSVVNGYEAMIGALNVELMKPDISEKSYLNTYVNSFGRGEININTARKLSKKWSVGLLTHVSSLQNKIDKNGDGFLDMPLYKQFNGINRWKFQSNRFMAQFGIKALYEDRIGGQTAFDPNLNRGTSTAYGFGSLTKRYEFFSKTAQLFQEKPYKGVGLIVNILQHENESYFGFKNYVGKQKSIYSNLIYQNIVGNTNHQYKAGASYLLDNYAESYSDSTFARTELVPGIFAEYTETIPEKITLVVGGRVDFHNLYGTHFTPRLHIKYDFSRQTHLRLSVGKGWRMPNIYAENMSLLANSRTIKVLEIIRPEESWNMGGSINHEFWVWNKKGSMMFDVYRTEFQNQLITDMESVDYIRFYNQRGRSFANSLQMEVNFSPKERLDIKLAYRWFDVQHDVLTETNTLTLLPQMFINRERVLFNTSYATKFDKWKVDFTWQWNGKRRIPDVTHAHVHTETSPEIFAPAFSNFNAQITRGFKKWEMYLGGENLMNFTQKNPILYPQDPFGKHFDASMIWGPVIGRMIYVGMRWKIH